MLPAVIGNRRMDDAALCSLRECPAPRRLVNCYTDAWSTVCQVSIMHFALTDWISDARPRGCIMYFWVLQVHTIGLKRSS